MDSRQLLLRFHTIGASLLIGLAGLSGGCSAPVRSFSEPVEPPSVFSMSGVDAVPDRWWTVLNDSGLNAAVDSALANNLDLLATWERLRAAQAITRRESASFWPSLEASATGERNRLQDEGTAAESLQLGFSASYEIDLWGRIRSRVQAQQFRTDATMAVYQTTALALAAEITRTWVQFAEAQSQIALVDQQIETNTTVLQLIENRFGLGLVRAVDILRQRQLVEATREQRTIAEARRQILAHRLAVLLGRNPQSGLDQQPSQLPFLAPLPDTGIPLNLIRRRPDIQTAFLLLQAADRDVASAISNQFPRLTLSASASTATRDAQALFQDWATTLAGNILAPIFFGGELRAEVSRTEAVRQERLYEYGQAVLTAFLEVEDALVLETRQRERIALIETQLELADQSFVQLRVQYLNGTGNYLDVLTALDEIQVLRRDLLAARLTLLDHRIALYRALAGSFEMDHESTS